MRVLQICAAYKPAFIYGGPTMSVSMLSEQLVKAGFATEVFTTTANGKVELPVLPGSPTMVDGVKVNYFKRITKDHTHFSPALFRKLWKESKTFDLVHIHAWWNLVSIFSCLIALWRNVPVLLSPRGTLSPYSFENKNIGSKWMIHYLLGKYLLNGCHVHVTSERENEAVVKLVHPQSITLLPNFVKLPGRMSFPETQPSGRLKLLFFSRIEEKKGLDLLINALKMVTVPFSLTIAGDGESNYVDALKALAINNKINDKISWLGFQQENKGKLLQGHDLFVLPSYDENFGNAVIESLSMGTAVLVSKEVGLADYVKKNDLGWVCDTNEESISAAINEIGNTCQAGLDRIRKDAPSVIYKDFDADNLVKKYIAMYNQLNHE